MKLLSYSKNAWIDEETFSKTAGNSKKEVKQAEDKNYDAISTKDFNKLNSQEGKQATLLRSHNIGIADVLKVVSSGKIKKEEDVSESEEERQVRDLTGEDSGEGEQVNDTNKATIGDQEKDAIHKYIKHTCNYFQRFLKDHLLNNNSTKDIPTKPLTLNEHSYISIVLDLINIFSHRHYLDEKIVVGIYFESSLKEDISKIEKRCGLERLNRYGEYKSNLVYYKIETRHLPRFTKETTKVDNLKILELNEYEPIYTNHPYFYKGELNGKINGGKINYITDLMGPFMLRYQGKAKKYNYSAINEKISLFQKDIFERTMFIILNARWKDYEKKYRNLLILDMLHSLDLENYLKANTNLINLIISNNNNDFIKSRYFDNNSEEFNTLISNFKNWKLKFNSKDSTIRKNKYDLNPENVIYSSKIGFCSINMVKPNSLILAKPGFKWNNYTKGCTFELDWPHQNVIVFS